MTDQEKARFTELLLKLEIPAEKITVFGRINLNVHIICKSRTTADKWAMALSTIAPGKKITCVKHMIERKEFKEQASNQTHMSGWLVAI